MINPYAASFMIAARTEHMVEPKIRDIPNKNVSRRRWSAPNHWRDSSNTTF